MSNNQHILICDDEVDLREMVGEYLERRGYQVTLVKDGVELEASLDFNDNVAAILLDVNMPGEDGFSILRRLRAERDICVIMLTAAGDVVDRIVGLEMGADDYISKPVRPRILLARIKALLRRSQVNASRDVTSEDKEAASSRLQFSDLVIDYASRDAWLKGELIDLTSAEFDLLWLLSSNAGRILSREKIFEALRGIEYDGQDRSIDVRVSRIRPKIGDDPVSPKRIKTVRSKGYLFVKDVS